MKADEVTLLTFQVNLSAELSVYEYCFGVRGGSEWGQMIDSSA